MISLYPRTSLVGLVLLELLRVGVMVKPREPLGTGIPHQESTGEGRDRNSWTVGQSTESDSVH